MRVKVLVIVLFLVLLNGCVSGKADLDNMVRLMNQDPPEKYTAVLNEFFSFALEGDVEGMLSITSDVTIKNIGLNKITNLYINDISPGIRGCGSLLPGGEISHVKKYQSGTGSGWAYEKSCSASKDSNARVVFIVLKEDKGIVVTYVGSK